MSSPDKKALRAALALEGADQVWAVVRALRVFTLADLLQHTNANPGTTRDYLVRLRRGGHVALERPDAAPGHYRLVRDVGRERPRLRKDGSEAPQTSREKMWRTMKMLGVFHYRSLAAHAQVAGLDARDYVCHLRRAGILRVVQPARPGRVALYMLPVSARTGPRPPQVRRDKAVVDPNTGRVHGGPS